jgi:ABC-type xylose transport system permease subunit
LLLIKEAANLLGFCLCIITSLHITDKTENSIVDEVTAIIALLLVVSTVFSFIAIRTENKKREFEFERVADYIFLTSLFGVFVIILFLVFNFLGL